MYGATRTLVLGDSGRSKPNLWGRAGLPLNAAIRKVEDARDSQPSHYFDQPRPAGWNRAG